MKFVVRKIFKNGFSIQKPSKSYLEFVFEFIGYYMFFKKYSIFNTPLDRTTHFGFHSVFLVFDFSIAFLVNFPKYCEKLRSIPLIS